MLLRWTIPVYVRVLCIQMLRVLVDNCCSCVRRIAVAACVVDVYCFCIVGAEHVYPAAACVVDVYCFCIVGAEHVYPAAACVVDVYCFCIVGAEHVYPAAACVVTPNLKCCYDRSSSNSLNVSR